MVTREEYLKSNGVASNPIPAIEYSPKQAIISPSVAEMKERLEIKKLEMELAKLEKPDTSIDYYAKMLELQEKHFQQTLQMANQTNELKLEIEKLKLMGDSDNDSMLPYFQMLAPLLPTIVAGKPQNGTSQVSTKLEGGKSLISTETPTIQDEEVKEVTPPTTLAELREYQEAIRRGEISFDEAWEDFLATPYANTLTKEEFKVKFDELKKSKAKD